MIKDVTIEVKVKKGEEDECTLVQPLTYYDIAKAYNLRAMVEGEHSVGEEDLVMTNMPTCLGLYSVKFTDPCRIGHSFKLWVIRAGQKVASAMKSDVEQGLCNKDAEFSKGMTVYVWNDNPQLATLRTLDGYDPLSSYPYKVNLYGTSVVFQHACPKEDGHPARDLIKELRSLFPKEAYGSAALSKGQAAILLEWASRLPVIFRDGTEGLVRTTIQEGVIVIEERKD